MSCPVISVILPTCNRKEALTQCLEQLAPAVQSLTADRYCVIVTDDGSDTAESLIHRQFPWARWKRGPQRGPASNRNHGVKEAKSEWIAFTDDDCLPAANWLEAFASAIRSGVDLYEGRTVCRQGVTSPLFDAPENLTGGWLWSCNFMVRKRTFEVLSGFDEDFPYPHMEDTDFRERTRNAGLKSLFVPEAVVDHPPKRRPWGRASGAMLESEVMFWYKQGNRKTMGHRLLWNVFRARTRRIGSTKLGGASVSALCSMLTELRFIAKNVGGWEAKYRDKYNFRGASGDETMPPRGPIRGNE